MIDHIEDLINILKTEYKSKGDSLSRHLCISTLLRLNVTPHKCKSLLRSSIESDGFEANSDFDEFCKLYFDAPLKYLYYYNKGGMKGMDYLRDSKGQVREFHTIDEAQRVGGNKPCWSIQAVG